METQQEAPKNKQKINYRTGFGERFSYGLYFFGQLIFYILITSFLQLYMTDMGIPAAVVGAIFMVAKVWDAINDPIFGVIVDKAKLKKGKYLPWLRLSTFLIPAASIFLFAVPINVSIQIKAIWITVGYALWDTSYTICDVPIFAVATSMTDNIRERDWLYMLKNFFSFVGGLIVIIILPLMYPSIGWTATVIIMSVFGIITMLPIGYKAKERYFVAEEEQKSPKLRDLVNYLFKNKPLLIFSAACIVSSITSTSGAVSNYLAIYCLGGQEWISIIGIISALPLFVSIIIAQQLVKKIDKRTIYIFCGAVNLALGVVAYFAGYENKALFMTICIIRAGFVGTAGVLLVMFTADCAEYGNYKTGERAQGVAFSIQTFTAKLTAAISGAAGMFMLGMVGFAEGQNAVQTPRTLEWIWIMYTLIPLISGAVSLLMLIFGYKLYSKDVAVMMRCNAGEISREEAEKALSRPY
ncbi:MAG: glycoside-pentoside-hexuronide (GPH):cation symporter [Oscillospiraceae bacterium]|nr:glycoside-pentoside-hexuronide (GPH):cation symporter [Oscillospiraceae bacterium]